MKRLLLLALLVSACAMNVTVEGYNCGTSVITGTLDASHDIYQGLADINLTRSYLHVGTLDTCLAPVEASIQSGQSVRLFAAPEASVLNNTPATAHVETTQEKVEQSMNINFKDCACPITISDVNVKYNPPNIDTPNINRVELTGRFSACTNATRMLVVLMDGSECLEATSVTPISPFSFVSIQQYTPQQAKRMRVAIFAWEPDGFGMFVKNRVDFSSFSVQTFPGVPAKIGGSTWVSIQVTNTGTLTDTYQIFVDTPPDWPAGPGAQTGTVTPDSSVVMNLTVSMLPEFKGEKEVTVRVISSLGIVTETAATVTTEKTISVSVDLDVPPLVAMGGNFTVDAVLNSQSTHTGTFIYYLYTDPATKIEPTVGVVDIGAEDRVNLQLSGKIIEACSVDPDKTRIYEGVMELESIANYLKTQMESQAPDIPKITGIRTELGQLQMKLVGTQVYDQVSRLQAGTQKLIEDAADKRDLSKDRENIAFIIEGLPTKIEPTLVTLFTGCQPLDTYAFKFVIKRLPDLETFSGSDQARVSIEDIFRIEMKDTLRLMAGRSADLTVTIFNVGDTKRGFDITALGVTKDWVSGFRSFDIEPGQSRSVVLNVRPPKLLTGQYPLQLIISTPPYALSKTVQLFIGKYGVTIGQPTVDTIKPGVTTTLPITISNQGEVSDEYSIDIQGAGSTWATWTPNVTIDSKGTTTINLTLSPPKTVKGPYFFDLSVNSREYPEIYDKLKIKLTVTDEDIVVADQIKDTLDEATALKDKYGEIKEVTLILEALNSADDNLNYGKILAAKSDLRRAQEMITELKTNPPQQTPVLLYALVIIVPVGGYLIYSLLSKKSSISESRYPMQYSLPPSGVYRRR